MPRKHTPHNPATAYSGSLSLSSESVGSRDNETKAQLVS